MRRILLRLLLSFRTGRAESDLSREIRAHLQLLEDEFLARGFSPEEAGYAARREFGGVEQVKERQRDARSFRWLAGWPMDLKLGARMLVKSPGLTVVAVLALSVAIGGGVAYLELVNGVFRPALPVPHADRLVGIHNWDVASNRPAEHSLREFLAWRESARTVEHLGAHVALQRNLITDDGRSEPLDGVEISPSAFHLVPTPPLLGRPLAATDEHPAAPPVVLIGYHLWQARFGGDPNIIGRTVALGNTHHTVIGVMPPEFGFPANQTLWVPLRATTRGGDEELPITIFGRLAAGADMETAEAELAAIAGHASVRQSEDAQRLQPRVRPYVESLTSDDAEDRMQMMILYSANLFFVGLLTLCGANIATLVFARTATREGEITLRTALGATRGRIVAQLFAEALVLSCLAAVLGLAAASWGLHALTDWVIAQGGRPPFWWNPRFDAATLVYAALLTVFAAAIIGIVPGLKATGSDMQSRLKHAAGGVSTLKFGRIWTGVIVAQVALTVIFLLTVVSLAWNASAGRSPNAQFAFNPKEFVTMTVATDEEPGAARRAQFLSTYRDIEQRIESEPAVAGVTYASRVPGRGNEFWVELDGLDPATRPADGPLWVRSITVAPDFFTTVDAPLVGGRTFTQAEVDGGHGVAVVDETFVRLILGGRDPIGIRVRHQQTTATSQPGPWLQIIGVVSDVTRMAHKTTEDAVLYQPGPPAEPLAARMLVRIKGEAQGWTQKIRAVAATAGPTVRLYEVQTLEELYRSEGAGHAAIARGLAVVAAVALLLATAGVYALMSFTLARRTKEIGIRTALGATPRRIISGIFSRAFGQIGLGVLAGSVPGAALVAFGAPEVAQGGGPLVAVTATVAIALLIAVIGLFACVPPARRALKIQPTEALRADG